MGSAFLHPGLPKVVCSNPNIIGDILTSIRNGPPNEAQRQTFSSPQDASRLLQLQQNFGEVMRNQARRRPDC